MMALNNPAGPPPQIMVSAWSIMVKVAEEGGLSPVVLDVGGAAPTSLEVAHKHVLVEYVNGSIGRTTGTVVADFLLVDA
jgi:hypothetical protein